MKRQLCSAIMIVVLVGCSGHGETPSLSSSSGARLPTTLTRSTRSATHHYGHGPNRGPLAPIADADIANHIDASLPDHDKDIMRKLMKRMHPSDRYYVMFFDKDGRNYANTLDVYNKMQRWKSIGNHRFVKPSGEVIIGPEEETPKDVSQLKGLRGNIRSVQPMGSGPPGYPTNTGALRRVWSDPGSSEVRTDVYIPCAASNFSGAPNGTGYVYEGGFGVSYDSLDAGFEYSFINDYYSLFTRDAANDGNNQIPADGAPFQCDQTVTLDFYSLADANDPTVSPQTVVAATGYDTTGTYTTHSAVDTVPNTEWPATGEGVQVKRMTTIAQSPSDFTSGYYFGYDPSSGGPTIQWSGSQIGASGTPLFYWPNGNGGTQSYPDDPTKVIVNYQDQADETDGINLHP